MAPAGALLVATPAEAGSYGQGVPRPKLQSGCKTEHPRPSSMSLLWRHRVCHAKDVCAHISAYLSCQTCWPPVRGSSRGWLPQAQGHYCGQCGSWGYEPCQQTVFVLMKKSLSVFTLYFIHQCNEPRPLKGSLQQSLSSKLSSLACDVVSPHFQCLHNSNNSRQGTDACMVRSSSASSRSTLTHMFVHVTEAD